MTQALAASHLRRAFGDEVAVDDVSIEVAGGQIHALVGLNGAGKTTLMRLLLGMLRADGGHALVLGTDARRATPNEWREVGHLIETPFAYPELTVRENLSAAARLQGMTTTEIGPAIDQVIDEFELAHWADRRASKLSLGNRQRLGLGSAVVHSPSVLVLDEPANALDPAGVVFTRSMLQQRAAAGAAVLVSSHHFDQLARVADVISVLHRGRIVGSLDPTGTDLEQEFFDLVREWDATRGAPA